MALTKVQTIGIETGVSLTGVTTVTTLNASTDTLSVGGTVNFGGNVSIAGTLTYEDVTNIDSVGIITARSGVSITGGDLTLPDSIIHAGDTNTKIRFPADDTVTVETGGSERLRIDSNGHLGVGGNGTGNGLGVYLQRSAPTTTNFYEASDGTKTMITGVDSTNDYVKIGSLSNHPVSLVVNNDEKVRIDSSGRLLAGSTSVGYTDVADNLTLADSGHCGITIRSGSSNSGNIYFSDTTGQAAGTYAGIVMYNHTNNNMQFWTNSVAHMLIDSSGRLLVGSSSTREVGYGDNASLQLEGTSYTKAAISSILNSNNANGPSINLAKSRGTSNGSSTVVQDGDILGLIAFSGGDGTDIRTIGARIQVSVDGTPGANDMPGRLMFSTTADGASSPTERLRIDSSGNAIFGGTTTSSTNAAYISSNGTYVSNRTSGTNDLWNGKLDGTVTSTINADGSANFDSLLIGTTAGFVSGYQMSVALPSSGGIVFKMGGNSTRTPLAFLNPSGSFVGSVTCTTSATTYTTSSDYRLKENLVDISGAIDRVKQLQPKRFNFIADVGTTVDGFLAHEAQTVVPEAVIGEKDGEEMQSIDQSKLVPLLTAALKESIAEIESLKTRVAALEG